MNESASLFDLVPDTTGFLFVSGVSRSHFQPHETDWRIFPYAVIVCAFDSLYSCEIEGEGIYSIGPGEAVVVPGGTVHRMVFENPGLLNCIHIRFTVFGSLDALSFFDVPRIFTCTGHPSMDECVDEMADIQNNGPPRFRNIFRTEFLAMSLLDSILEKSTEKHDIDKLIVRISALSPVLDFIRNNLDKNISRKTLAEIMRLSETRFHYVFKSSMGISPMKYLRDSRLQKAFILLSSTQFSINEISNFVGYSDYSNFCRQFKSRFGKSPSEAREDLKQNLSLMTP